MQQCKDELLHGTFSGEKSRSRVGTVWALRGGAGQGVEQSLEELLHGNLLVRG
jgi:hypothetical protein